MDNLAVTIEEHTKLLEESIEDKKSNKVIVDNFKKLIEALSQKLAFDLKNIADSPEEKEDVLKDQELRVQQYKETVAELAHYIDNKLSS